MKVCIHIYIYLEESLSLMGMTRKDKNQQCKRAAEASIHLILVARSHTIWHELRLKKKYFAFTTPPPPPNAVYELRQIVQSADWAKTFCWANSHFFSLHSSYNPPHSNLINQFWLQFLSISILLFNLTFPLFPIFQIPYEQKLPRENNK